MSVKKENTRSAPAPPSLPSCDVRCPNRTTSRAEHSTRRSECKRTPAGSVPHASAAPCAHLALVRRRAPAHPASRSTESQPEWRSGGKIRSPLYSDEASLHRNSRSKTATRGEKKKVMNGERERSAGATGQRTSSRLVKVKLVLSLPSRLFLLRSTVSVSHPSAAHQTTSPSSRQQRAAPSPLRLGAPSPRRAASYKDDTPKGLSLPGTSTTSITCSTQLLSGFCGMPRGGIPTATTCSHTSLSLVSGSARPIRKRVVHVDDELVFDFTIRHRRVCRRPQIAITNSRSLESALARSLHFLR